MPKTAILVDGGFYRKRALHLWGKKSAEDRAKELSAYCYAHINDKDSGVCGNYTEYFIMIVLLWEDEASIIRYTRKNADLDKSDTYTWTITFLNELKKRRKFALRLGELSEYMSPIICGRM